MAVQLSKAQQQKVYNAALFALSQKQFSFINMMTGKAPKGTSDINKKQTDAGAPIVRVEDLSKGKGDEVTVDIVHDINKEPTMGDRRIEGRGDSLTFSDDTIKIDQTRHMVDSGGKMQQQSTGIALPPVAMKMLQGYYKRLEEERMFYHAAGARGDLYTKGMIVPTSDAQTFKEIMINEVTAPTVNRKFYGGDATGITDLESSDIFSLSVVDNIWLSIAEADNPLQHLRFDDDKAADDNPFYVMLCSPRQWDDFYTSTSGKEWSQMIARAQKRSQSFNHQVFKGDCLMYRNIVIKPYNRFIQFNAGSNIMEGLANGTEQAQTVGVKTHRAILMGSQALAMAWGNAVKEGNNKSHFTSTTEKVDHGNAKEHSIAWMNGAKKLRFKDRDGNMEDHGIIVADTAVSG